MRKELEEKLVKPFPTWFTVNGDVRQTLMLFGFQCGNGWFEILWRLCVDLEPMVAELEKETGEALRGGAGQAKARHPAFLREPSYGRHRRTHRGGPEGILPDLRCLRPAGESAGIWRLGSGRVRRALRPASTKQLMHRIADAKLTTSTFNLYSPYFGDFE